MTTPPPDRRPGHDEHDDHDDRSGPVPGPVTAVGDSIMLDIQPELTADLPGVTVDGLVSRQFEAGIGVVQADRAAGTLGRVLVVELGTNGVGHLVRRRRHDAGGQGVSRVVFVNVCVPRDWAAGDNAVLAAGVARYSGVAVWPTGTRWPPRTPSGSRPTRST